MKLKFETDKMCNYQPYFENNYVTLPIYLIKLFTGCTFLALSNNMGGHRLPPSTPLVSRMYFF